MPACVREIIREGIPGIFHCWSRCCRRAYLLGKDPLTGKNHNHRRQWVIQRLELLAANFAIDTCFLAVLANHLHLVLRTTPRLVTRMGTWEVARRWLRVFPGRRVLDGHWIEPTEEQVKQLAEDKEKIKKIRKRLASVSWFMAALSEYIARRSNIEDDCTGRFGKGDSPARSAQVLPTWQPHIRPQADYAALQPVCTAAVAGIPLRPGFDLRYGRPQEPPLPWQFGLPQRLPQVRQSRDGFLDSLFHFRSCPPRGLLCIAKGCFQSFVLDLQLADHGSEVAHQLRVIRQCHVSPCFCQGLRRTFSLKETPVSN